MSDALSGITVQAPSDPDAQATVTDFLDYTEYLHSDLRRSLNLIGKLDEGYHVSAKKVHQLTEIYGALPALPRDERPDPELLRKQIAVKLSHAISARESSYAEASRLYDVVDRHYNRLTNIITKLHSLPKPPSRDPTPEPISSQTTRARGGRKVDQVNPTPRITLRLDAARSVGASRLSGTSSRLKKRNKRPIIPGEVLPPPNPDSPPPSTESEYESVPPSPIPIATSRVGQQSRSRSSKPGTIRQLKSPRPPKIKIPKAPRGRRPAGVMGTNVHSAVAGISSSNALALLEPPPPDAVAGSEHAPWLRLTEWEMAKLRKRMKKNAVWTPSETMIRRELSEAGRGPENYRIAKARANETGQPFVDGANIANTVPGTKTLAPGEISADTLGLEEMQLSNRGMKLNEAKKLKKETQAREQAAMAAAEAEQAAQRLADAGSMFKNIFSRPPEDIGDSVTVNPVKDKEPSKTPKKRKREVTPEVESKPIPEIPKSNIQVQVELPAKTAKPGSKKRKLDTPPPLSTITTTIPLAAPGSSAQATPILPSPAEKRTAAASRSRRTSVAPKTSSPDLPPSRPRSSRGTTANASVEPPSSREHLRRASTISAPPPPEPPQPRATGRRSKRPAPGTVTADPEGGTAVSVGRRKAAPRKKAGVKKPKGGEKVEEDAKAEDTAEEIDPDEPRYCVCGDVSYGTMVCCENNDCECEWFHLECVGLSEPPGKRTKWYCPDCQKKLGVGEKGQVNSKTRKR